MVVFRDYGTTVLGYYGEDRMTRLRDAYGVAGQDDWMTGGPAFADTSTAGRPDEPADSVT